MDKVSVKIGSWTREVIGAGSTLTLVNATTPNRVTICADAGGGHTPYRRVKARLKSASFDVRTGEITMEVEGLPNDPECHDRDDDGA